METVRNNPFTDIMDKVSFVNFLPMLTTATYDNSDATPGYLLQEIENISRQPDPHCPLLVDYLTHRLGRPSAPVKLKVLKIMVHLTTKGPKTFRKYLRKKDGCIKIAASYQEIPDALTGSSVAEAVRREAQGLLQQLFEPQLMITDECPNSPPGAPSEVRTSSLGGLGTCTSSQGKYEGFGNSPLRKEASIAHKMKDTLERWSVSSDHSEEVVRAALTSSPGQYEPVPVVDTQSLTKPQPHQALPQHRVHIPGRAGGGWEDNAEEASGTSSELGELRDDLSFPADLVDQEAALTSGFEASVVQDFCTGHLPCALVNITSTGRRCMQLNVMEVVQAVTAVLEAEVAGREQVQVPAAPMRALLLLEWLVRADVLPAAVIRQVCESQLLQLATGSCKPLGIKAEKLLLILRCLQGLPV